MFDKVFKTWRIRLMMVKSANIKSERRRSKRKKIMLVSLCLISFVVLSVALMLFKAKIISNATENAGYSSVSVGQVIREDLVASYLFSTIIMPGIFIALIVFALAIFLYLSYIMYFKHPN